MSESTTEHFLDLRRQTERIKMYENYKHDWRKDLQEEHPYVDVMPMQTKDPIELLKKAMKKKKEEGKEEVSEAIFNIGKKDPEKEKEKALKSRAKKMMEYERLKLHLNQKKALSDVAIREQEEDHEETSI